MSELENALGGIEIEDLPDQTDLDQIDWSQKQLDVFEFVKNGSGNAVVEAVAGSGKTSTIVEALKYTNPTDAIAFVAFNKRIADELRDRSPDHVHVSTLHSLGLRNLKRTFPKTKVTKNKMWQLFDRHKKGHSFRDKELLQDNGATIIRLVSLLKAVLLKPSQENMNYIVDHYNIMVNSQRDLIYAAAHRLWHLSLDAIEKSVDFDDMIFAPAYGLAECEKFDFLFVDEAQDLNNSQIQFVLKSVKSTGRVVAVGDRFQCQPAGTKILLTGGQEKNIEDLKIGEQVISYDRHSAAFVGRKTQGRRITRVAERKYTGELITVSAGRYSTQCTSSHKWLTRFEERTTNINVTYLMKRGDWYRVGWCQLFMSNGSSQLAMRARLEGAEYAWILGVHNDKASASIEESIIAMKYGLPTIMFETKEATKYYTEENIQKVFTAFWNLADREERITKCLKDYGRELNYPFYNIYKQQRQGRTTIFETQACNLLPDIMCVPIYKNERNPNWTSIKIERQKAEEEKVYSLDIETHHKYIANNMLTCNSIYGFRGADTQAIPNLIEALDAISLPLTITYRCPTGVVALAQKFVPHLEARADAPTGIVQDISISDMWELVEEGDLVICRTNAPLVPPAFSLIRRGIKAIILGREIGAGLIGFIDRVGKRYTSHNVVDLLGDMSTYTNFEVAKLLAAKKNSRAMSIQDQFNTIVALADGCTEIKEIKQKIREVFADDRKGVTFSSIHKIKGGEAKRVFILEPSSMPHPLASAQWEIEQEFNTIYVAYTRAKEELYFVN